jgi:carbonic anhydrase
MQRAMWISGLGVSLVVLVFAFVSLGEGRAEGPVHWSYSKDEGPAHWGELSEDFFACSKGKNQSPINITQTLDADLPTIELSYRGETAQIINNGHTIQFDVGPGNTMRLGEQTYTLTQFHFHSPAEHRVAGESSPFEGHFVHQNERGEIAVVSVLYRSGAQHEGLHWLGVQFTEKVERRPLVRRIETLNLMPEGRDHFRYHGSLTTPPCTEGITWLVLTETSTFGPEQVARFIELIGADSRPLQPLNGRLVLH